MDPYESDSEDTLSLSDFVLDCKPPSTAPRPAAAPEDDLFEFFSDRSAELCDAEDVFHAGTILPFSEGNAAFQCRRSHSAGAALPSHGRGGSGRQLRRAASADTPKPTEGRCSGSGRRPRWHLLAFGLVQTGPPVAEMSDIRSRQRRRSPTPLLAMRSTETASNGKSAWRLLRVLSCRGQDAVAVGRAGGREISF